MKTLKRGIEYCNNHCAMCFKVSDDVSSVSHTGLNINNYHNIAPAAGTLRSTKLVRGQDSQYATYNTQHDWLGYYSSMINSSYTLKYDINNIAHAIFIVYTISGYKGTTEVEDNYLFYSADDAQTISVCFLNDEKTIRVKGADTDKTYFDVNKFPGNKQNPCATGNWNVICAVYDNTMEGESSLWVNEGKAATTFNGQIGTIEIYNSAKGFEDGVIMDRMAWLGTNYSIPRRAPV